MINYSCMLKQNYASVCLQACVHKCSSLPVAHLRAAFAYVCAQCVHLHKCAAGVRAVIKVGVRSERVRECMYHQCGDGGGG